jgi:hypothetical protein
MKEACDCTVNLGERYPNQKELDRVQYKCEGDYHHGNLLEGTYTTQRVDEKALTMTAKNIMVGKKHAGPYHPIWRIF